jgi:hypothetical protein
MQRRTGRTIKGVVYYFALPLGFIVLGLCARFAVTAEKIATSARTLYLLDADQHPGLRISLGGRSIGSAPAKLPCGDSIRFAWQNGGSTFLLMDANGVPYQFGDGSRSFTCDGWNLDRTLITSDFEKILYGYFRGKPLAVKCTDVWRVILREFLLLPRADDLNLGPSQVPLRDYSDLPANEAATDVAHICLTVRFYEDWLDVQEFLSSPQGRRYITHDFTHDHGREEESSGSN